jgi:glucosamine-6-phosphate deaminase
MSQRGPYLLNSTPIYVGASRADMGRQAASDVACELRRRLAVQHRVRMIFAAAPSQSPMLDALITEQGIDWGRVSAFHMDEYLGLAKDAPQNFGVWLSRALFDRLPFAEVHLLSAEDDPLRSADAYARKLNEAPIDIVCLGVGVNGHLAFNDPPVDFDDAASVKIVHLDEVCRKQQVNDGCFGALEEVPTSALTLTIPRLLAAQRIYCCVPGLQKRKAMTRMLEGPMGADCPATALHLHPHCVLYMDTEAAPDGVTTNQEYRNVMENSLGRAGDRIKYRRKRGDS